MDKADVSFSFGQNWRDFLDHALDADRIDHAKLRLQRALGLGTLDGLTFLDIGCGSGLHSYVAHELGAERIVSFDVDPFSVACCRQMRKDAGDPEAWEVFEGSIVDTVLLGRLPQADVVYSWGVLHHTGDMYAAIRNAASLVKPGGRCMIAIYNRVEYNTFRAWRGSPGWLRLKRAYNRAGWIGKRSLESVFAAKDILAFLVSFRNPFREIRRYREKRGMSWWYDIVDWLGGYPYEFASAGEIVNFCQRDLGLQLEQLETTSSIGCHEFLFRRPVGAEAWSP